MTALPRLWPLVVGTCTIAILVACHHPRVARPSPVHLIGAWPETDVVCVELPAVQALYLVRRCVAMATIRAVILTMRSADEDQH